MGIIPDGNRRFAKKYGLTYFQAYRQGYEKLRQALRWVIEEGVKRAVVYVMSYENCTRRSSLERAVLEDLLINGLRDLRNDEVINGEKIKVKVVGDLNLVSDESRREAAALEEHTASYSGGSLHLGVCYSGEWERQVIAKGLVAPSISAGVPQIDLVIRTGSMRRLSGFFPLQTSYAELYFMDLLWPELTREELKKALEWFGVQKRNFGN
ncbi:undecaprenyl diphosphate synthase family protein [Acidilobus sp. 7A]|uniref:undecaprenyl diphosphate synthase family protein n=1 Tax=Acidilobus sp. 7A TaxID=1577685 RepID=UPI000E3C8AC4